MRQKNGARLGPEKSLVTAHRWLCRWAGRRVYLHTCMSRSKSKPRVRHIPWQRRSQVRSQVQSTPRGASQGIPAPRSRSALPLTDTELRLIADAAIIGDSSQPENWDRSPAASGCPERCRPRPKASQDLLHVRRLLVQDGAGLRDAAQISLDQRHLRAVHGDVGARSHRHADVGVIVSFQQIDTVGAD